MNKENKIRQIERTKSFIEDHFQQYKNYERDSRCATRKKDRERASENMSVHIKYIEDSLGNPLIYSIIDSGQQFQFELFERYVDTDVPKYLKQIEIFLEELKSEMQEE